MINIYNFIVRLYMIITPFYKCVLKCNKKFIGGDFDLLKYKYKYNNKYVLISFINELGDSDLKNYIKLNIQLRPTINHCCIMRNNEYIKDITDDIRQFIHYFQCNNDVYTFDKWEFIKYSITESNNDDKVHIYMNDDVSTEIIF